MPVSMVCESTANVNAALRDSLAGNCSTVAVSTDDGSKTTHGGSSVNNQRPLSPSSTLTTTAGGGTDENDDIDTIQSKLVASAKRVLMSKIDYEEVSNYGQSVLDTLKTKYILLQPANNNNNRNGNMENGGRKSPANNLCNGNNNNPHATNGHCNANSSSSIADNNTTTNGSKANGSASAGNTTTTNANASGGNNNNSTLAKRPLTTNSSELPQAKRVLFPRELVRIGWKNSNRKWQIGSGFLNMGNTCYLNSTLQALFHVPSMANWLMSDSPHMDRCDGHDTSCIICAMIKTLQSSQNSQSAIRPYFICSKLKLICKTMAIGRQEDAHEFLRHLVDAMERSYLQRFHYYKELDQYSKETTPLNQILGGYLKSSVRCLSCSHVSVTFQHFQDILLDIRKGDSIEEAMEMYFARERLEDMGYKCESCKKKVSATKQFSLERAPIVLCIQLKRFSVMGAKLNKQITMKTRLDLSKFASRKPTEQLTYRLVSMITHLGATQHCGHYTAIGLTESGNYYCYDDSSVRPISVQSVCNTNAYVIFYEMDNTAAARVDMNGGSSTNAKENYQKQNGHVLSNGHNNHTPHQPYMNGNSAKSPQRIIGPQLPPGGLAAYKASPLSTNNNGGYAGANGGPNSKLQVNRQNSIPTSNNNNKLMIHFKNTPNSITNKLNSTSSTSSNTNTTTSESSSAVTSSSTHNGGAGKFQSSSALADAASKGQNNAIAQSSSPATDEDEVSSSTGKHLLPDMPNLLLDSTSPPTRPHSVTPLTNGGGGAKLSLKSLVPYDSESDADDELADSPVAARRLPMKGANANGSDLSKSSGSGLKRRYSIASYDSVPNLSPKKQTDGSKSKTDAIDDIFNYHKRNTTPANGHQKKQRPASYCSYLSDNDEDSDDDYDKRVPRLGVMLDFTKAPATPPSPPVVETKTGIWQVTQIQSEREKAAAATEHNNNNSSRLDSNAGTTELQSQKSPKNLKNPFASKPVPETAAKRPKLQNGGTGERREGNGYQRGDANSDGAVSELLKQSHRGYGAPVLTWNGQQTEVEKENISLYSLDGSKNEANEALNSNNRYDHDSRDHDSYSNNGDDERHSYHDDDDIYNNNYNNNDDNDDDRHCDTNSVGFSNESTNNNNNSNYCDNNNNIEDSGCGDVSTTMLGAVLKRDQQDCRSTDDEDDIDDLDIVDYDFIDYKGHYDNSYDNSFDNNFDNNFATRDSPESPDPTEQTDSQTAFDLTERPHTPDPSAFMTNSSNAFGMNADDDEDDDDGGDEMIEVTSTEFQREIQVVVKLPTACVDDDDHDHDGFNEQEAEDLQQPRTPQAPEALTTGGESEASNVTEVAAPAHITADDDHDFEEEEDEQDEPLGLQVSSSSTSPIHSSEAIQEYL